MQSRPETMPDSPVSATPTTTIPSDLLLSVATTPLVLALMGGKVLSEAILEMSRSSEAVFAGARLPVLHFPDQSSPDPVD